MSLAVWSDITAGGFDFRPEIGADLIPSLKGIAQECTGKRLSRYNPTLGAIFQCNPVNGFSVCLR